tara:strand:- start:20 stop:439 length:420 start_codon:yes stop_codon:yes gene_type:complete
MNYIYFILFLLFLIIGGYMTYQYLYNKKTDGKKFIPNKEFQLEDKTNGDLYFFYTEWCPYSKKSEKVWDAIRRSYSSENLKLNFLKVDCDTNKKKASDFNIKEYPTIILVINEKKYVYDADLNELTLYKFLEAVTQNIN